MLRNKIYQNYIKEILKNFFVILLSLSIIAWAVKAVNYLDLIVENGYSVVTYLAYSVLSLTGVLMKFMPLSFLVSIVFFITKHKDENEFTILWTSGIKKIHIVNLLFFSSILVLVFYLIFSVFVTPFSLNQSRRLLSNKSEISIIPTIKKNEFSDVLQKTGNISLAKKAATAAQVAEIPNVLNIQNQMPCIVKNITDKLLGDVTNLVTDFTNNVQNFTDCIGDQFIGAIFNDVIKGINSELGDAIKGVANIFPSGDIEGLLRNKAEGILGLASIFSPCDVPDADIGSKTNKWLIGLGPASAGLENIAGQILSIANAAQELKEAAASPGGVLGNLGFFDFMRPDVSTPGFSSTLSDCYTGPPLNCSGIKVNLFGGGGSGAEVNPILGSIVSDTFAKQTASLIGMKVKNPGSGYTSPPFVEIEDTCRKGYGAVARSVIDYDPSSPTFQQVTDVYIVSAGENYPVIEPEIGDEGPYTVDHVVVVKPGQNYKQEDIVTDQKGNIYEKFLDEQGRILNVIPPNPSNVNLETFDTLPEVEVISSTGTGALLKAQLAPRPSYQGEVRQVIDCISPRNTGIVGFINGEPYYGAFHVHPTTGAKMVGVAHTTAPHAIIYDTPQESRTSRSLDTSTTSFTTISSAPVQTNVSDTTTTSQSDTSSITQTDPVDTSSQQTSGQSYTPPPSSPPSGGGSSGSGGGSSGGGGYGGGY